MHVKHVFFLIIFIFSLTSLTGCGSGGEKATEATPRAITVSGTSTNAVIGKDIQLTALLQYTDATSELITDNTKWKSGNTVIATVTDNATVTCLTVGETTIIASYNNFTFDFVITCNVAPYIVEIKFSPASGEVNEGKNLTLFADAILSNGKPAKNINFVWSIPEENAAIASIDYRTGILTGLSYGTTRVLATIDSTDLNTIIKLADTQEYPSIKVRPITKNIILAPVGYDEENLSTTDFDLNLDLGETGRIIVLEEKTDGSITDISQKITKWDYQNQTPSQSSALVIKGTITTKTIGSTSIGVNGYNGTPMSNLVTINVELPLEMYITQESGGEILLEWRAKFSSPQYRISRRAIGNTEIDQEYYETGLQLTVEIATPYEYTIGYQLPDGFYSNDDIENENRTWVPVNPTLNSWRVQNSLPTRAYASSVIYNNSIYAFGGEKIINDETSLTEEVWQYAIATHSWTKKDNLPMPIKDAATCEINGTAFIFGGSTETDTATDQILSSNLINGTWTTATTTLIEGLTGASCSTDGITAYISGGINTSGTASNKVYSFSAVNNTLTASTTYNLNSPRHKHQSLISNGQLYIAGGIINTESTASSTVEVLDLSNSTSSQMAQMINARQDFTMALINNKIYAFGGVGNQNELLNSVEFFTPSDAEIRWKQSGSMPYPNSGFIAEYTSLNKTLFLFGGTLSPLAQNTNNTNQMIYSANDLAWYPQLKPQDNIYASSFGRIDEKIYLIGGRDINDINPSNKGTASNQTQQYNIAQNAWLSDSTGPGPLNTERAIATTASTGDRIYVFGGVNADESYLNTIEVLGEATSPNSWILLPTLLLQPRADACAIYHKETDQNNQQHHYIYIIGGINSSGLVETIERYNLDSKIMENRGSLTTPRAGLSCISIRNTIYLIGGYDETSSKLAVDTVEAFYPKTQIFEQNIMSLKNGGRIRPALTTYNDRIYTFGGISDNPSSMTGISATQTYTPLKNLWAISSTLTLKASDSTLAPSNATHAATIGNKIYVFANNHELTYDPNTQELNGLNNNFKVHVRE